MSILLQYPDRQPENQHMMQQTPPAIDLAVNTSELPQLSHAVHLYLFLSLCLGNRHQRQVFDAAVQQLNLMRPLLARFELVAQKTQQPSPLQVLEELARRQYPNMITTLASMQRAVVVANMIQQAVAITLAHVAKSQPPLAQDVKIDPEKLKKLH